MIILKNGLNDIQGKINSILKELSSGEKNLNSQELNKELSHKENIDKLELANKQISDFLAWSNMLDKNISYLKGIVEETKGKLIKGEDVSDVKGLIEKEMENEFLGMKLFENKKVLVSPGVYKELNISKIDVPELTLENINSVFDGLNLLHMEVGYFNSNIERVSEFNSKKILINKGELSNVDYTESVIKLNQLKIQFEALSYTLIRVNELSLIKFLN